MNNIAVITGANGMDAKTLTHLLLKKGYKVILTYRRNSYFDENNIKKLFVDDLNNYKSSVVECEVCDISCQNSVDNCIRSILKNHSRIDELYHLAGMSHVGHSFNQKELSIVVNGQSHYYFLEALKNMSPKTKYYGAMTSELIGGIDNDSANEFHTWHPRSPYAIGKEVGARWIDFYRESSNCNLFSCYGILFNHSNFYRTIDFAIRKITNTAAKIASGKTNELRLGHLNWFRDEHWADFGCEMMWKMLQLEAPQNFVIGTEECHSGEEYVTLAFNYFNLDWKKYVKLDEKLIRPNEVVRLQADSTKAKNILGWIPNRISFKTHIELLCDYDYNMENEIPMTRLDVFEYVDSKPQRKKLEL